MEDFLVLASLLLVFLFDDATSYFLTFRVFFPLRYNEQKEPLNVTLPE